MFLKDPQGTSLGSKIVEHAILQLDALGFEDFTFKKLSEEIGSTEASIYRYFENKHQLLTYLMSWYWNWFEYQLELHTFSMPTAEAKLRATMRLLTTPLELDMNFEYINEKALQRVVISESSKSYLRKTVDDANKDGCFAAYKRLTKRIADMIRSVNPNYKYADSLVSTVIEGTHMQLYFVDHLPALTNIKKGDDSLHAFYSELIFKAIDK